MAKLELRVTNLAGNVCTVLAEASWTVLDVKRSLEESCGVPVDEQRLLGKAPAELSNLAVLSTCAEQEPLELTLVRVPVSPNRDRWLARVQRDGCGLCHAPKTLQADREIVGFAVHRSPQALRFAADELRADREIVTSAVSRNWMALRYAAPGLQADRELVIQALLQDGRALEFAAPVLRADRALVSLAVQQNWPALIHAGDELKVDPDIVALAVQSGMPLARAPEDLHSNRQVLAASFSRDGRSLRLAADEFKEDWQLVAAAVMRSGQALKHAGEVLKNDFGLVMLAIQQDGNALRHASVELRRNRELVSMAVQHPGQGKMDAVDDGIHHDGDLGMQRLGLGHSYSALQYAADSLRSDKDLVLIAVACNGRALQYTSAELRADREVVLAAVRQNWAALRSAAPELRAEREIVSEALRQDSRALRFAAEALQGELGGVAATPRRRRDGRPPAATALRSGLLVRPRPKPVSGLSDYPLTIPFADLAFRIEEAKEQSRMVLVLASDVPAVEAYFSYQMGVVIDCKQLLGEVFIRRRTSMEQAQQELKASLMQALDSHNFCKPLHLRMAGTAFDWHGFCFEGFPAEVFSGTRWTVQEAFVRGLMDESQRMTLELDPARFKDFQTVITSTFDLEGASHLTDKIPYFSELATLVIDPASIDGE
ncbi:unnamed protein product [Polarella glacialis]|uniref:Ubiquitin-like domain-containing protein n=2 Tax=Polarella glacialis TaxID=89957 RepID=A0A813K2M9_POLGL|nr:unnamed protein product [Polarella glacialis]